MSIRYLAKEINLSHMSLIRFLIGLKVERFVNERNLKNRGRSQGVACRCHQVIFFKWAHLGLSKIISDYLLYLEKINIFFNIITKKV